MRRGNTPAEIPVPEYGIVQVCWDSLLQQGSALRRGEQAAGDHWLFEFAVIKTARNYTTRVRSITDLDVPGRHAEGVTPYRLHGELRLTFCCSVVTGIADEGSLANPYLACASVKTCSYQIP